MVLFKTIFIFYTKLNKTKNPKIIICFKQKSIGIYYAEADKNENFDRTIISIYKADDNRYEKKISFYITIIRKSWKCVPWVQNQERLPWYYCEFKSL